jgi:hypothetical protein
MAERAESHSQEGPFELEINIGDSQKPKCEEAAGHARQREGCDRQNKEQDKNGEEYDAEEVYLVTPVLYKIDRLDLRRGL